jgi:hypothetical protein
MPGEKKEQKEEWRENDLMNEQLDLGFMSNGRPWTS